MKIVLFFVLFLMVEISQSYSFQKRGSWSYEQKADWADHYSYCGGHKQSPIDINEFDTKTHDLGCLTWATKNAPVEVNIENNGHSLQVSLVDYDNDMIDASGAFGGDVYRLIQFHMHWGSEHKINGERFALEAHFVTYNTKYENAENAKRYSDGFAVIAVLFNKVDQNNDDLGEILKYVPQLETAGSKITSIKMDLDVASIMPTGGFYRYNGSLTTPGCNEVVVWSIFATPGNVGVEQIELLKTLKDHDGQMLNNNYREPQALHGRVVTYSPSDQC